MRATFRLSLWSALLLVAWGGREGWARAPAEPASAQAAPAATIPYTIKQGDTPSMIATQHYGSPSAVRAIFEHNRAVLKAAYEENSRSDPTFNKRAHPFGSGTIFPGTVIELPTVLKSSRGRLYQRRGVPMTRELAAQIAENKRVNLQDMENVSRQLRESPALKNMALPRSAPVVSTGYSPVTSKSEAVNRGERPAWYRNPANDLQRCAQRICEKYKNLCYFDCLTLARRFEDGLVECSSLPNELPFEIDSENENRCLAGAP